jgi:D-sedoheptulose 7-phosphate isomerase
MRNSISGAYIPAVSSTLARTGQEMSRRFRRGGRLLALGRGPYATDAQHISVEFIHPIVVGKRALPALDLSNGPAEWLDVLVRPDDIVMAFGPPAGDDRLAESLARAARCGALACQWPGHLGHEPLAACSSDPFIHQEMTELMYHTLWETVHVFFEQEKTAHDAGASSFLYPFLDQRETAPVDILTDVAASICTKAAADEGLRAQVAAGQSESIAAAAEAIAARVALGGTIVAFGNGGSATDANDLVIDCIAPPDSMPPIPAISLSMEPATLSAIANDVGVDLVFMRQLIATGRAGDVAIAISTSGKSQNICAALHEARKRGMLTVALLGYDGGDIVREKLADYSLVVPWDYIPRIQEVQASIYHVLRRALAELAAA